MALSPVAVPTLGRCSGLARSELGAVTACASKGGSQTSLLGDSHCDLCMEFGAP